MRDNKTDYRVTSQFRPGQRWIASLFAVTLVGVQFAVGGETDAAGLSITVVIALVLIGIALSLPRTFSPERSIYLVLPGVLFLASGLASIISLLPRSFDEPHITWSLVPGGNHSSVDLSKSAIELVKLLCLVCAFCSGFGISGSTSRIRFFALVLMGVTACFGALSIMAYALAPTTVLGIGYKTMFHDRLTASYSSPNTAGTFFAGSLVLAMGAFLVALRRSNRMSIKGRKIENAIINTTFPLLCALVSSVALLLSTSRTAMVAAAICSVFLVAAEGLTRKWRPLKLLATLSLIVVLVISTAVLLNGGSVIQRLNALDGDSLVRTHIYQVHAMAMKPFPLMGFGLGNFPTVNTGLLASHLPNYGDLWLIRSMHNVYMQWVELAGWLGAAPMFLSIFTILTIVFLSACRESEFSTQLWCLLAASLVILIHGLTDFALENLAVSAWWSSLLGVAYGQAIKNALISLNSVRPYRGRSRVLFSRHRAT